MTECLFYCTDTENPRCECDNCGHVCNFNSLELICDVQERLNPGSIVPAGQCPECGALSYLQKPPRYSAQFDSGHFSTFRRTLREELDALNVWKRANLPADVREGMAISRDKIKRALADAKGKKRRKRPAISRKANPPDAVKGL